MFSNFKDTFINKPQFKSKPPQAVIEDISDELPDGFRYEYTDNGFCRLETDDEFNLQSGNLELPQKARKVLDKTASYEDIQSYSYNSQTPLIINPDKNGGYIINGKHIDAKDFVKAPMQNLDFEKARLVMYPKPLDLELRFSIGGDGYEIPLVIHRVPNESINVQKFESDDTQPIKVIYYLNPKNYGDSFSFSISLQLDKAKTTKDVLGAYKVYNAFLQGKGSIDGNLLEINNTNSQPLVPENVIFFWEKMNKVEQCLNISFDISIPLRIIDSYNIEALYRSLIEKKPFIQYKKYNSISGTGEFVDDFLKDGNQAYFEYEITETMDILGQSISVNGILGLFGSTVVDSVIPPKGENGPFEIFLDEAEGKKMFESKIYFLSKDDLDSFRELSNYKTILAEANEIETPDLV